MFDVDELKSSHLSLQLLPYGMTVHGLKVTTAGSTVDRDVLIGPQDVKQHHLTAGRKFINQVIGRYANRLPSGRVEMPNGPTLNLSGDGVCLHGGGTGLDTVEWTKVSASESALFKTSPVENAAAEAIYRTVSAASTDGYPCTVEIEAYSGVSPAKGEIAGKVSIILRARLVDDGKGDLEKGCPINLTVHWFFNCSDFGSEDLLSHRMFINADRTPTLDDQMLATGEVQPIPQGHGLDFYSQGLEGKHRLLSDNFPEGGVDHNLIFKSIDKTRPQVVLTSPDSKVSLAFRTNQSTVQCYTAGGFDSKGPARKTQHDPRRIGPYGRFSAVALEFHAPLATFLHDEFKQIAGTDTILRGKEQVYENWVEIEVRARD